MTAPDTGIWLLGGSLLLLATVLLEVPGVAADTTSATELDDPPPAGVVQLLPRGRIAAIVEPQFVTAAAAEIPEDAWVLGVMVAGRPKAYSLNLLNRHEVVNDQSSDTAYAAVW